VKSNQSTPILQCHGDADHLVNHGFGKMSSQLISCFNDRLQFKSYPGLDHCYCDQVLCSFTVICRLVGLQLLINYEGRSINKLQNGAISLNLKIGKIRNIRS